MSGVGHDYSLLSLFTWSASPDQESHCELIYLLKYTNCIISKKEGTDKKLRGKLACIVFFLYSNGNLKCYH